MTDRISALLRMALVLAALAPVSDSAAAVVQDFNATNLSSADLNRVDALGVFARANSVAITSSTSTGGAARLAGSVLGYNAPGNDGGSSGGGSMHMQITFNVLAAPGEAWAIDATNHRLGAITLIDRNSNGYAGGSTDPSTCTFSGAGTMTGSLNLANNNVGIGEPLVNNGAYLVFDQTASARIDGVGTGSPQALSFDFNGFMFGGWQGHFGSGSDEAAVRMGVSIPSIYTTAADYPGVGARDINGDGDFVLFALVVPEPGSFVGALFAAGVTLARFRRRYAPPSPAR